MLSCAGAKGARNLHGTRVSRPQRPLTTLIAILESKDVQKPELEWTHVWPVAIRALGKNFLVEDHRFSFDQDRLFVTRVASNIGMPTLEREMRARIVIED